MEQLTSLLKKESTLLVKENNAFAVSSEIKALLHKVETELSIPENTKEVLHKLKNEYSNLETIKDKTEREDVVTRFLHFVQLLVINDKNKNYQWTTELKAWYEEQTNNLIFYKGLNASEISGV